MDRFYDLVVNLTPFLGQDAMSGAMTAPAGGAASTGGPAGCGGPEPLIMMLVMFAIMYFLMIRPQKKRMQKHKEMVEGLKRGDNVITSSGIVGRITAIDGNYLQLEIAKGVNIRVLKSYVGGLVNAQTEQELSQTPQAGNN